MVNYSAIFPLSGGGGGSIAGFEWSEKTADFTAEANKAYYVDTALGDVLMTLPSNPAPGDEVAFLIIGANRLNITTADKIKGAALATDFVKQTGQQYLLFILFYIDSTTGWSWDVRYDSYIGNAYIGAGDPLFNNVVLFLKGDGANNSTSIIDSSASPKTIAVHGNAKISTTQSKYGGSSIYLDGSGDYLGFAHTIGSNTFCFEAWVYPIVTRPEMFSCVNTSNAIVNGYRGLQANGSNWGLATWGSGLTLNAQITFALNTWQHIAFSKNASNVWRFFKDGTLTASATNAGTFAGERILIGFSGSVDYPVYANAYFDSIRLTQGNPRYTANFNPETDAFLNL